MLLALGACTRKAGTGNSNSETTETKSETSSEETTPSGGEGTVTKADEAPVELPPIVTSGAHAGRAPDDCDVVVVDSSLGGVFAALESARQGVRTCLTSMTNWIGGQISTQSVCAIDAPHNVDSLVNALMDKFGKREEGKILIADNGFVPAGEYKTGELDLVRAEAMKCMDPLMDLIPNRGMCWVSYDCCRPKDAEGGIRRLLEPAIASGNLVLWEETVPKKVLLGANGQIEAVQFVKRKFRGEKQGPLAAYALPLSREISGWYDLKDSPRYKKQLVTLKGKIFIDATETGELAVLAKAKVFQGELDDDCNEVAPENVMGFVFPLNLGVASVDPVAKKAPKKIDPLEDRIRKYCPELATPEKFKAYAKERFYINWGLYDFWPAKGQNRSAEGKLSLFAYRRLSDNPPVSHMNFGQSQPEAVRAQDPRGGNDYSFGNFLPPASALEKDFDDWRGGVRPEELAKAECHSLAFARWLEGLPEVRDSAPKDRRLTPIFDVNASNNFYGTGTGLAKFPYVRDTRHIRGYRGYCMKPRDFGTSFEKLAQEKDKAALLRRFRESPYYARADHSIGITTYAFDLRRYPDGRLPTQAEYWDMRLSEIPMEAAVSENIPNLLAAGKNIALHQIIASAARTQPFECNVGRGVGAVAAVSVRAGRDVHHLMESPGLIRRTQKEILDSGGTIRWFGKPSN